MSQGAIIMLVIGSVTFFVMLLLKIPVKKCTWGIAERWTEDEEERNQLFHRLNLILVLFTVLISMVLYCLVLLWLGETHFKLCHSLKGAAVAMALYALVEQWMGPKISMNQREE